MTLMSRLVLITFLSLSPVPYLSEGRSDTPCNVIVENQPGIEFEILHRNILCLHERLDAIQAAIEEKDEHENPYIPLEQLSGQINPCGQPGSNSCFEFISSFFNDRCEHADCTEGLAPWRSYMTPEWQQFVDTRINDYKFNMEGLKDVPRQEYLFIPGETGQTTGPMLDMKRFFQTVTPSMLLHQVPNNSDSD